MDGLGAHRHNVRVQCRELVLGRSGHDKDHEREEASGDAGWEEVLRSGAAVEGDAEAEQGVPSHAWG